MTATNKTAYKYNVSDEKWNELAEIGILRDEIELAGQLEKLLLGEPTDLIYVKLVLLGVDVDCDATLQLVGPNDDPILEIISLQSMDDKKKTEEDTY